MRKRRKKTRRIKIKKNIINLTRRRIKKMKMMMTEYHYSVREKIRMRIMTTTMVNPQTHRQRGKEE